jgi:hypothetical protein
MNEKFNEAKCSSKLGARIAYRVRFLEPPESGKEQVDYLFSSLAAIYGLFTARQIGCGVNHLWNRHVADGEPYSGRKCQIERVEVLYTRRGADDAAAGEEDGKKLNEAK